MRNNWEVRKATKEDLDGLLMLYMQLHNNPFPKKDSALFSLWNKMLNDSNHHILVAEQMGKIISSCVISIIPNLTHGQQPYALIENVVTDEQYRKKGCASAVLETAKQVAKENDCYKIMLMTGSKDENTLHFYEQAGYNRNDKTAFIQWLE